LKQLLIVGLLAMAGLAAAQANSEENFGSLVPVKDFRNPVVDRTARNVGDILTVVVSEVATSNVAASTNATKKEANNVTAPLIGALKIPLIKQIIGDLSTGADSTVNGSGTSTNSSQLSAKVAVIVKQVLPNGNMVIEGTRWVKVNREETNITFTGIVRRDDVRADNTVASANVAEARITNVSKGLIAERQRKGFITKLLDWLF
jgi:flagellar L-ring protein precursor FlgH